MERLAQSVLWVGGAFVVYQLFAWVAPVLAPVLVSLLIAYFLDPVIDRFEARKVNRTLAILFIATVVIASVAAIGAIVIPVVVVQLGQALRELPLWIAEQYEVLRTQADTRLGIDLQEQLTADGTIEAITTRVQSAAQTLATSALDSVASLLNIVLIPVFTFYFLRDFDSLKLKPLVLVPPRYHDETVQLGRQMDSVVGAWLRGQVQVALMLAVFYAVGLGVVGIKLGVFIGILAGLLNVVPYFGVAIGLGLSVLMTIIYGEPSQLIGVAIVFAVAQILDDYVIKPRLVGDKVGMSPTMVMAVLLLGGSLFGFFGLLLSIPVVAAGTVLAERFRQVYRSSDFYTRSSDGHFGLDDCDDGDDDDDDADDDATSGKGGKNTDLTDEPSVDESAQRDQGSSSSKPDETDRDD